MVAQIDSEYKRLGTGRVARRLLSYAMFEGRPATTKGQFFNPIVFAWLKLLSVIPGRPSVKSPIFVLGLGRSGTTILGMLLSAHRDVGFLNEPKAVWHCVDPRHDLNDNYSKGIGQYRLSQPSVRGVGYAHRIFGRYLSLVGASRLVDKYPEMIFRVDFLLSIFPDAKLVFISRDGRSATQSIVKWSQRLGVKIGGRVDDWWGRNDAKWHCLRDQVLKVDPYFSTVRELLDEDLDHCNRAALEWVATMREGLKESLRLPDKVYRIEYEKLIKCPVEELDRLLGFCGLERDSAVIDYASKVLYDNPAKGWPSLEPRVDRIFRETMEQLGYA